MGMPADSSGGVFSRRFDAVASTAGIPVLRVTPLPAGEREVRVWIGGGPGYPQRMYRFIRGRGRVRGEEILHWPGREQQRRFGVEGAPSFEQLMVDELRGGCGHFRRGETAGTCRVRFRSEPRWSEVLARTEAAGLWEVPDESTLPGGRRLVIDGWSVTVELRDGTRYRSYAYFNPDRPGARPEAARAAAVAAAMGGVDSVRRLPDAIRFYRGVTRGTYQSAFTPCGGRQPWEFHADLGHLAREAALAAPDTSPAALNYVEVIGTPTPVWLARQWNSSYVRALQVNQLVSTRPWTGEECRQRVRNPLRE
jgi:hypothetical protein